FVFHNENAIRTRGPVGGLGSVDKEHTPTWALEGGREGSANYAEVIRRDGRREIYAVVTALTVNNGDVIRIHTASGGGYGDPRKRSRDKVLEDLKNGFISAEVATEVYGVTIS
ncbi:hydantoinase B/oxoprolinase family protein, partial [Stenotrophomonas maltophilia]